MTIEERIQCAFKVMTHRAIAAKYKLPLHFVMFVLGLMGQDLFDRIESESRVVRHAA